MTFAVIKLRVQFLQEPQKKNDLGVFIPSIKKNAAVNIILSLWGAECILIDGGI